MLGQCAMGSKMIQGNVIFLCSYQHKSKTSLDPVRLFNDKVSAPFYLPVCLARNYILLSGFSGLALFGTFNSHKREATRPCIRCPPVSHHYLRFIVPTPRLLTSSYTQQTITDDSCQVLLSLVLTKKSHSLVYCSGAGRLAHKKLDSLFSFPRPTSHSLLLLLHIYIYIYWPCLALFLTH